MAAASSSRLALSPSPADRPRFGQVRRDHGRERQHALDERLAGAVVEQAGAALGDHHRIHHDRRVTGQRQRLDDRVDRRRGAEHADLDGVDPDVGGDGRHLGDDDLRRHGVDRIDARRCSAP